MTAALSLSEALFGRPPVGAGAGLPTLQPGDKFAISVQIPSSWGSTPLQSLGVPAALLVKPSFGLTGPPDISGNIVKSWTGIYSGPGPMQILSLYTGATIVTVLSASVLAHGGKIVVVGTTWHLPGGLPVSVGIIGGKIPPGVNAPFSLQQGQRYSLTIKASGGALPASFPTDKAGLQAQIDAAGIQATVVSAKVSPDGTTLFVEEDHCAPNTTVANPTVITDGGVTVTTNYQVMGAGSCSAVQPVGWSSTKKVVVYGGAATAVIAAAAVGTKLAGWW